MAILFYVLAVLVIGFGLIALFVSIPADKMVRAFSFTIPTALILMGMVLTLLGRGIVGLPMIAIGFAWTIRTRAIARKNSEKHLKKSIIRSAAIELIYYHHSKQMAGRILVGDYEGKNLQDLSDQEVLSALLHLKLDNESNALFEAYLDRRLPHWREDAKANSARRKRMPPSTGTMTKQEAYQVLGLHSGATSAEIRKTRNELMQVMQTDRLGDHFLAAKIDTAKEILLN